jgi:type II secretion system protein G
MDESAGTGPTNPPASNWGRGSLVLGIVAAVIALIYSRAFHSAPSCEIILLPPIVLTGLISGILGLFRRNQRRQAAAGLILSAVAIPLICMIQPTSRVELVRAEATKTTLVTLQRGLQAFKKDVGRLPTAAEGLKALPRIPSGLEGQWRGPYVREADIEDKWGLTIRYMVPASSGSGEYELVSAGSDGQYGTSDDLLTRE